MKKLMFMAILLMCSVSICVAEGKAPVCEGTKYSIPLAGISYGMDVKSTVAALNKGFPGTRVKAHVDKIEVSFPNHMQELYDQFLFLVKGGRVTEVLISYSDSFQKRQGGPSDALMGLLKTAVDKYGKADTKDDIEGGIRMSWEMDKGAQLQVTGKDPFTVVIGYACIELSRHQLDEQRKKTNFGF